MEGEKEAGMSKERKAKKGGVSWWGESAGYKIKNKSKMAPYSSLSPRRLRVGVVKGTKRAERD
jgi:hypothetical protein